MRVTRKPRSVTVAPASGSSSARSRSPGDFSAAAPFVVAGTLLAGSELTIHGVNLNPRRTGLLDVLERMGANITVFNRRRIGGEPAGDLDIRPSQLVGTTINAAEVPLLVDELPLFALLAVHAHGDSASAAPPSCARRRPTGSRRSSTACAGSARTSAPRRTASPSAASRRGSAAAARSTPAATTGSRCSARSPGSSRARASEVEGAEAAAVTFPGFYDLLDSLRATTT